MQLRVATYNIRKCVGLDWRRKPERILSVIAELNADIIALQEADKRFGAKLATLSHLHLCDAGWHAAPLAVHDGGIGWHGNAILVRDGTEVTRTKRLHLPSLEPRGAVIAELSLGSSPLRVVGAHLGLTRGMRLRQTRHILSEIEDLEPRPTIVMGDLNSWHPSAGCISLLANRFTVAAPEPTFHSKRPVAPLDRIGVSNHFTFVNKGVHRSHHADVASDHLPLWADVELNGRAAT